jgi:hypothetical protein
MQLTNTHSPSSLGPKKDEKDVENFEQAFKDLSRYVYKILLTFSY